MLFRDSWVYKQRMKIIEKGKFKELNLCLDYSGMMAKFWVWDIEKLKKKPDGQ